MGVHFGLAASRSKINLAADICMEREQAFVGMRHVRSHRNLGAAT